MNNTLDIKNTSEIIILFIAIIIVILYGFIDIKISLLLLIGIIVYMKNTLVMNEGFTSKPIKTTFKIKDAITGKYLSMNRNTNESMLSPIGIELYIDNSSKTIMNRSSGSVGVVDFANDNFMQNLNGSVSTTNKIIVNPTSYVFSSDFTVGKPEFSWIFCKTEIENTYIIYNSGSWLNYDGSNVIFSNISRHWIIEGDIKQVADIAVQSIISIQDNISKQFLKIDNSTKTGKLSDIPSYFVFNDVLQKRFYESFNSMVLQNMYNGLCLREYDSSIITEDFMKDNPKFGWIFFKTQTHNGYMIYSKTANKWFNSSGTVLTLTDKPTMWIISGSGSSKIKSREPVYKIQDIITNKYINFNRKTDESTMDDVGAYLTTVFVNGVNESSGVFIDDIYSGDFLKKSDEILVKSKYTGSPENYSWAFINVKGQGQKNVFTIFKLLNGVTNSDKKKALYLDYDNTNINIAINENSKYRQWKKMMIMENGNVEGFSSNISIIEGIDSSILNMVPGAPPGPMDMLNSLKTADMSSITKMIPPGPNGTKPDSSKLMSAIVNTISKAVSPEQKKIDSILKDDNVKDISPFSFKSPKDLNITYGGDSNIENDATKLNQYAKALLDGNITLNSGKTQTVPMGKRYFMDTNSKCDKSDGTGSTTRYILVDNMKYSKYSDGSINTNEYGLLYSAAGSLQEVDSNATISQLNDINSKGNKCINVNIDLDGQNATFESKPVTIDDCNKIDKIAFRGGNKNCEGFSNYDDDKRFIVTDDVITHFYFGSMTVVGLFILYRLMNK